MADTTVILDQIGTRLHTDEQGRVTWDLIGTQGEMIKVLCKADYLPLVIEALTSAYQNAQVNEAKASGKLN